MVLKYYKSQVGHRGNGKVEHMAASMSAAVVNYGVKVAPDYLSGEVHNFYVLRLFCQRANDVDEI